MLCVLFHVYTVLSEAFSESPLLGQAALTFAKSCRPSAHWLLLFFSYHLTSVGDSASLSFAFSFLAVVFCSFLLKSFMLLLLSSSYQILKDYSQSLYLFVSSHIILFSLILYFPTGKHGFIQNIYIFYAMEYIQIYTYLRVRVVDRDKDLINHHTSLRYDPSRYWQKQKPMTAVSTLPS